MEVKSYQQSTPRIRVDSVYNQAMLPKLDSPLDQNIFSLKQTIEPVPPLEQAIQMLELGYSEDEVYAWWGEELLEEALEWIEL